jgi:phosphoribosylaminoimidazolecarboxamide formyltransferase/IMP cyclohydrolase
MPDALLSVWDKRGLVPFAERLVAAGFRLLSTGGTARALREAGLPVTDVAAVTGAPEMMEGRVKTLHPIVAGGILAHRQRHAGDLAAYGIGVIDLVVCNLYPFESVTAAGAGFDEAIEHIDVGGPTMVRAAAKNHAAVTVVVDPDDYGLVADALEGAGTAALRPRLAAKAFAHTARYDAVIAAWLAERVEGVPTWPAEVAVPLRLRAPLRYGENPHQGAAFYVDATPVGRSLARATVHQGKELSFNNLADVDAALRVVFEFDEPACCIVKHLNPCGLATSASAAVAFEHALEGDPVSAFGGVVAFNRTFDAAAHAAVRRSKVFFEVLAAPGFDPDALAALATRPNLRVLELPADWASGRPQGRDARRIQGGWLIQDWDHDAPVSFETRSARAPTADELAALRFAWKAVRGVKSNGIALARAHADGHRLNGVGAGQPSRVDSVRIALSKATAPVPGCVLASDAFFPFPDGVVVAAEAGVTAIAHPGGSMRDAEVLAAADAAGIALVFTGIRHFRH